MKDIELIQLKLSRASNIFSDPLLTFLPIFGFAKNRKEAEEVVRSGKVKVNGENVPITYVLQSGDLIQKDNLGIVISEE